MKKAVLSKSYYETPNPYVNAPSCHVNLLELSKYAREKGKKLAGFGLMVMAIANILLMIEDGIDMVRELIGKDELECEDDEFKEIED